MQCGRNKCQTESLGDILEDWHHKTLPVYDQEACWERCSTPRKALSPVFSRCGQIEQWKEKDFSEFVFRSQKSNALRSYCQREESEVNQHTFPTLRQWTLKMHAQENWKIAILWCLLCAKLPPHKWICWLWVSCLYSSQCTSSQCTYLFSLWISWLRSRLQVWHRNHHETCIWKSWCHF